MSKEDKNKEEINKKEMSNQEKSQKIQSLREMIGSAEKTIQSAKAMLLQLEGKKKVGRKRKMETNEDSNLNIIQGTFDGQLMIGTDGKQYPVPANYASKSKLIEGDMLKLTITDNGSFVYKQIGPIERRHSLGIVYQDEADNYYILVEGKPYKVLLASITYFKVKKDDKVSVVMPKDAESTWVAIENTVNGSTYADQLNQQLDQNEDPANTDKDTKKYQIDREIEQWKTNIQKEKEENAQNQSNPKENENILNQWKQEEWADDLKEKEKEEVNS